MEPLGLHNGIPYQAIRYKHPNGERCALVVPVPAKSNEEWQAWVDRQP